MATSPSPGDPTSESFWLSWHHRRKARGLTGSLQAWGAAAEQQHHSDGGAQNLSDATDYACMHGMHPASLL